MSVEDKENFSALMREMVAGSNHLKIILVVTITKGLYL